MNVTGVIFDKDGTLFDLQATWSPCAARLAHELAGGDRALLLRLMQVLGYDPDTGRLRPDSMMIAETPDVVRDAIAAALPPEADTRMLRERIDAAAGETPQVPAAPLLPLFDRLVARGIMLACVTNDAEGIARLHLREAGIETRFHAIVGFDSGYGAKPDPSPLLAVAASCGLEPCEMLMVGDNIYDMRAGQAAGMRCVGVLTGASPIPLAPPAEVVLPHIGHFPDWLDSL